MSKSVAAHTLGCKVNQHETDSMLEMFRRRGYQVVDFEEPASVYIINTCTVTHLGDRKSRQAVRQAVRRNPEAKVVVTGCYAQRSPEEIAEIPGVSLIVGNRGRDRLVDLIEGLPVGGDIGVMVSDISKCRDCEELPLALRRDRTRATVKVQEGCSQFCTYCIVPYTRGPVRSRREEIIVEEIISLVEYGYREVVLTGIHTSAYGQDFRDAGGRPENLATLVKNILVRVPALPRLRISSVEPTEVPEAIADLMNQYPVLCPHLHLPLQSGDDEILSLMRRPYSSREYAGIVDDLRSRVDGLSITADIMVGFPGEEERHFLNSFNLVSSLGLSDLHVFKYSPRPGTPAAAMPGQVSPPVKEERSKKLHQLAQKMRADYVRSFLGDVREVLLEHPLPQIGRSSRDRFDKELNKTGGMILWEGYTDNYLRVAVPLPPAEDAQGRLVKVELKGIGLDFVSGEII